MQSSKKQSAISKFVTVECPNYTKRISQVLIGSIILLLVIAVMLIIAAAYMLKVTAIAEEIKTNKTVSSALVISSTVIVFLGAILSTWAFMMNKKISKDCVVADKSE